MPRILKTLFFVGLLGLWIFPFPLPCKAMVVVHQGHECCQKYQASNAQISSPPCCLFCQSSQKPVGLTSSAPTSPEKQESISLTTAFPLLQNVQRSFFSYRSSMSVYRSPPLYFLNLSLLC